MKIYKLSLLNSNTLNYEDLISCELNLDVLSVSELNNMHNRGFVIRNNYDENIFVVYYDYDTACIHTEIKEIVKRYNRIDKLYESI